MEALFYNIETILKEQAGLLDAMLDTARQHHRALRQLKLNAIKKIVSKEQSLTEAFKKLEDKRMLICLQIAKNYSLPGDTSFRVLIDEAPSHLKEQLMGLLDKMAKSLGELLEINKINTALNKQALAVNQMILKSIKGMGGQLYSSDGVIEGKNSISLLDIKA